MGITESEYTRTVKEHHYSLNHVQLSIHRENEEIISQRFDFKKNPLYWRFHHIYMIKDLVHEWDRYTRRKPWDVDDSKFMKTASDVSDVHSLKKVTDFQLKLIKSYMYYPNMRAYYEELIGEEGRDSAAYKNSLNLLFLNFLLRAKYDQDGGVVFNRFPDRICNSCRGGVSGIGKHCVREVNPVKNRDNHYHFAMLHYLKKFRGGRNLRKGNVNFMDDSFNDSCIKISYELLFNKSFQSFIEKESEKIEEQSLGLK